MNNFLLAHIAMWVSGIIVAWKTGDTGVLIFSLMGSILLGVFYIFIKGL